MSRGRGIKYLRGITPAFLCWAFEPLDTHLKWVIISKINKGYSMSNTKLEVIQFHNQSLIVLNHENKPYIAIKPICENIGLNWEAQR